MNVILQRITPQAQSEKGTFGVWLIDYKPYFVTLELPWKDNQKGVSCIPAGTYKATKVFSEHFQRQVYLLANVPNRDAVEIHIGNTVKDIRGCIIVGMEYNMTDYAITSSGVAFDKLMSLMPSEFDLTICDCEIVI